jgi:PPE-repeat protein
MTAPIWIAFPPEVHSTLLSSGPGPGPLLSAAATWSSMGSEYASAAEELSGLLGTVEADAWNGPTAAQYAAAHAPYLSWLHESAAKSAVAATLHETAATAYTAALAAMPSLPELAANHAVHATLVATNFFGINTIPIAVNEADYARMWVQAAETMTAYQAVSESALAAVPATSPAPQIVTADAVAANTATTAADTPAAPSYPAWQDQLRQWLQHYTSTFAWPVSKLLNPNGWPFPPVPFVNAISSFFTSLGFSPTLATAIGWAVFHTLMIFWPFMQIAIQMAVVLAPVVVAAIGAAAAGGAAAAATAISIATPLSLAAPVPAAAPAPTVTAPAPTMGSAPTSVSTAPTTSSAPAPTATATAGAGPVGGGPGVGFGPTATDGIGAGMSDALYAVGLSGLAARGGASGRAHRKSDEPAPGELDAPAAAAALAAAKKRARARRRRPGTAKDRAYRYEYLDLDQVLGPDTEDPPAARPSEDNAGRLGFAGVAAKSGLAQAAGLTTLACDGLNDGPAVPMMPTSWGRD